MNIEQIGSKNLKVMKLKPYLLAFICPKKVVNNIEARNQIDKVQLLFTIVLSICCKLLRGKAFALVMLVEVLASILIFVIFLTGIFRLAKGKISFWRVTNLSVYIHIWVILASLCSEIPVLSVITFIGVQLLGVYLQYLVGIHVAHADAKCLKSICLVELFLVLFSTAFQLLTTWGKYVAYSSRTYYFPLILK